MNKPDSFTVPPVLLVHWLDAIQQEASEPHTEVIPQLAGLVEVGFLVGEDDTTLVLGMELGMDEGDVSPGRWRLHIPKSQIQSIELLTKKRPSRAKRPTPAFVEAVAIKEDAGEGH